MMIICVVLAVAAPSMRGWSKGQKMRNAAMEFVGMTKLARTQAISTSKVHRIKFDPSMTSYMLTVQDGDQWTTLNSEDGMAQQLPEGMRLEWADNRGQGRDALDFYPTGRCDAVNLAMRSDAGDALTIECATPTENYRVVIPGATR